METLQFKIYNTLLGKQSILAFEEFLYTNENILNNLESNSFFYKIVTLNYRLIDCLRVLEYEASIKYGEGFIKVLTIERSCIEILTTTDKESYYLILQNIILEFDIYSTTSLNLSWNFYNYYEQLGMLYVDSKILEGIYSEIEQLAKEVLEKMESCPSLSAKKAIVFEKPPTIPVKKETKSATTQKTIPPKKTSLRKKIAQFFSLFATVH
ncbi:hypothetical protein [Kordia sp.]|uniref:hypothetical protein n=1 Tax=Kordia sp. TaxID=1965332 RepID=UPI003D6C5291